MFDKSYYDFLWGTVHRHDYAEQLSDLLIQKHGLVRYLDVGCGCGALVTKLNEKGADAKGIDISQYALVNSHENVFYGDVRDIPFPDNSFEVVHSQGLWGYFPEWDIDKAWSECRRVGKTQIHTSIDYACKPPQYGYVFMKPFEWWKNRLGEEFYGG